MYINKATILGNLTRDPELRSLPSGVKVVSMSIATNRYWKDQNGAKQESVEYHNAVAFGKPAEIIAQYMKKGSSIYIEGRIQTRSWDGNDGQKRYRTEIVVENFQFCPAKGGNTGNGAGPSTQNADNQDNSDDGFDTIEYPDEDVNLEDIPF